MIAWIRSLWAYHGPEGYPYCVRRLLELSDKEQSGE